MMNTWEKGGVKDVEKRGGESSEVLDGMPTLRRDDTNFLIMIFSTITDNVVNLGKIKKLQS